MEELAHDRVREKLCADHQDNSHDASEHRPDAFGNLFLVFGEEKTVESDDGQNHRDDDHDGDADVDDVSDHEINDSLFSRGEIDDFEIFLDGGDAALEGRVESRIAELGVEDAE